MPGLVQGSGILMPFMFSFEGVKFNNASSISFVHVYLLLLKESSGFPGSPFAGLLLKS